MKTQKTASKTVTPEPFFAKLSENSSDKKSELERVKTADKKLNKTPDKTSE